MIATRFPEGYIIELLEWGRTFSDFWGKIRLANVPEFLYCTAVGEK